MKKKVFRERYLASAIETFFKNEKKEKEIKDMVDDGKVSKIAFSGKPTIKLSKKKSDKK